MGAKEISDYGFLIVFAAISLGGIVWIGRMISNFLLKQWDVREARIASLEAKVETISNGQRTALEARLDSSAKAEEAMAAALTLFADAIRKAPCGKEPSRD
jgi:hypothetical protein